MRSLQFICLLFFFSHIGLSQSSNLPTVECNVNRISANRFSINFTLTLVEGTRVISPFSLDTCWAKVNIQFNEQEGVRWVNEMTESPVSKEEWDPIQECTVRFNRNRVTYKWVIERTSPKINTLNGTIEYMLVDDEKAVYPEPKPFVVQLD